MNAARSPCRAPYLLQQHEVRAGVVDDDLRVGWPVQQCFLRCRSSPLRSGGLSRVLLAARGASAERGPAGRPQFAPGPHRRLPLTSVAQRWRRAAALPSARGRARARPSRSTARPCACAQHRLCLCDRLRVLGGGGRCRSVRLLFALVLAAGCVCAAVGEVWRLCLLVALAVNAITQSVLHAAADAAAAAAHAAASKMVNVGWQPERAPSSRGIIGRCGHVPRVLLLHDARPVVAQELFEHARS